MGDEKLRTLAVSALGAVAFIIALALLVNLVPMGTYTLGWSGDLSPLEIITTIATPAGVIVAVIGLFINGRAANRTLEQSVHATRAAQFQAACNLAAASSAAAKTGGLYMMCGLAVDDPEEFLLPVFRTLDAMVIEADADLKQKCGYFHHPLAPAQMEMPGSDATAAELIDAISIVQSRLPGWHDLARKHGAMAGDDQRLIINTFYLKGFGLTDLTLAHVHLNKVVLGRCLLRRCDLRGSLFTGVVFELADFSGSDVRGMDLNLVGPNLDPVLPVDGLLSFEDCKTEGLRINGHAYADWLKLEPSAAQRQLEPA